MNKSILMSVSPEETLNILKGGGNEMITQEDIKNLNKFRNSYYNYPEEELRNVAQVLDKVLPKLSQQEKKDKLLELYQTFLDNYVKEQIWTCPLLDEIQALEVELKEMK